jgi:hypothetical protein
MADLIAKKFLLTVELEIVCDMEDSCPDIADIVQRALKKRIKLVNAGRRGHVMHLGKGREVIGEVVCNLWAKGSA